MIISKFNYIDSLDKIKLKTQIPNWCSIDRKCKIISDEIFEKAKSVLEKVDFWENCHVSPSSDGSIHLTWKTYDSNFIIEVYNDYFGCFGRIYSMNYIIDSNINSIEEILNVSKTFRDYL